MPLTLTRTSLAVHPPPTYDVIPKPTERI